MPHDFFFFCGRDLRTYKHGPNSPDPSMGHVTLKSSIHILLKILEFVLQINTRTCKRDRMKPLGFS